jgi:hypothetical protein
MRQYITLPHKPRLAHYEDGPDGEDYLSRTVFEPDDSPMDTGLLDSHGNPLYAVYSRQPIGFVTR